MDIWTISIQPIVSCTPNISYLVSGVVFVIINGKWKILDFKITRKEQSTANTVQIIIKYLLPARSLAVSCIYHTGRQLVKRYYDRAWKAVLIIADIQDIIHECIKLWHHYLTQIRKRFDHNKIQKKKTIKKLVIASRKTVVNAVKSNPH